MSHMDTFDEKLYDPELDRMVSRHEVPSEIWEELVAVNEFLLNQE